MNAGFTDEQVKRMRQAIRDEIDRKRKDELRTLIKDDMHIELKHFVSGDGQLSGLRDNLVKYILKEEAKKLNG